jgi:hypothetical protein
MSPSPYNDAERLYRTFCELNLIAQTSGQLNDALAAGRAWGRFLSIFCPCCTLPPGRGRFRCIDGGRR